MIRYTEYIKKWAHVIFFTRNIYRLISLPSPGKTGRSIIQPVNSFPHWKDSFMGIVNKCQVAKLQLCWFDVFTMQEQYDQESTQSFSQAVSWCSLHTRERQKEEKLNLEYLCKAAIYYLKLKQANSRRSHYKFKKAFISLSHNTKTGSPRT